MLCSFLSFSCTKDHVYTSPSAKWIIINSSTKFSHQQFAWCFRQIITPQLQHTHDYSFEINENGEIQSSFFNHRHYGPLGNEVHFYEHIKNENSVIVSSQKIDPSGRLTVFNYTYNEEGYIQHMDAFVNGALTGQYNFIYDVEGLLISKQESIRNHFEYFTYNDGGLLIRYENVHKEDIYHFHYNNGKVSSIDYESLSGDYYENSVVYEYLDERWSKEIRPPFFTEISYSTDNIFFRSYNSGRINSFWQWGQGLVTENITDFKYENEQFEYAIRMHYDPNFRVIRKEYLDGSTEELNQQGYANYNYVDEFSRELTTGAIYDSNHQLQYTLHFSLNTEAIWYLPDGTVFPLQNLPPDNLWMLHLSFVD